ncbi:pyridoxamine 5'-phosphate oxidase family protein [uncultured Tateyamaria sp.]|uniref:pyridoxamine 5'-phosphate oxidase family protein n=1 Tax=uncultured Tateyamaria sp. TaxID=455651 RepID=UPI0026051D22|nr:pyridoxamine 5'-phosphate oxidase family protein [uncultured Tateyamaria sp.]
MTPDTFYTSAQRKLQRAHDREALADAVFHSIVADQIDAPNKAFIESRDFFFLSTVAADGMPTVSHKGGAPGVVQVVDPTTLVFPNYDGNGMFRSMGNAMETGKVGLLFIDFETPNRVRIEGHAQIETDAPELSDYPGANMLMRVAVSAFFLNCARYVHKHVRQENSPYVPDKTGAQPHPSWKRIDAVQDTLTDEERNATDAVGGPISPDDYVEKLSAGQS